MKHLFECNLSCSEIARAYGVSAETVRKAVRGRLYAE